MSELSQPIKANKPLTDELWFRVLVGLLLGVGFGFAMSDVSADNVFGEDGQTIVTNYIKPIGIIFINLIKMVVIPLIFFSLISGVTSMTDADAFKRIGLKAVLAFLFTSAFAMTIGLTFANVIKPGEGVDLSSLHAVAGVDPAVKAEPVEDVSIIQILVDIIPTNIVAAMADDRVLQVVVFAIFVGVMINKLGDKVPMVREVSHQSAQVVFKMIETVIKFSPYGVFALTSWVVATQGLDILIALVRLIIVVMASLFTHYLVLGIILVVFGRISPWPFYKKMLEPQLIAFSTSSSKATLASVMRVVNERIGVSKTSTSFILPLGASVNMDGTAVYLGICALFFSQAYGIPLEMHHYFILILTATLGSIGAAGIPGGSLIMMGMVLTSVGLPLEGIALIAGIDRILDMMRTTLNVTSDAVITVLVDKSEGLMDMERYHEDV